MLCHGKKAVLQLIHICLSGSKSVLKPCAGNGSLYIKTDLIIRLFLSRLNRTIERRMSAYGKRQLLIRRILHLPDHLCSAAAQPVSDLQHKRIWILCESLLRRVKYKPQCILCFTFQFEFHVPCKPVLSHGKGMSLRAEFLIVHCSHKGKQNRRRPSPKLGICLPHVLRLCILTHKRLQFSTM